MRYKQKRITRIFAGIVCAAILMSFAAPAAAGFEAYVIASGYCGQPTTENGYNIGENVWWSLDSDGDLYIEGTGAIMDCDSVWYWPWYGYMWDITRIYLHGNITTIGTIAFQNCKNLKSVEFDGVSSSLKTIRPGAFQNCGSLEEISLPNSVEEIAASAFNGCTALKNVHLSENLDIISTEAWQANLESGAFEGCTSLEYISIPSSLKKIGDRAFSGCTSLEYVYMPTEGSLEYIGYDAFKGCEKLNWVSIPGTVSTIGGSAFSGCVALTGLNIPDSVRELGAEAFSGCTSLHSVGLSDSITRIRENTFVGCEKLEWISIGSRTVEIGENAFQNCIGIEEITIPKSVRIINDYAFDGCTGLKEVFYLGKETNWENIIIWGYNDPLINAKIHYLADDPEAIIGSGYCGEGGEGTNLTWTLTYGGTITISGQGRMEDFPRGPGWMGDVFDLRYRVDRKRAVIEEGVTNISDYAFDGGPDDISTISIPKSVTEIGNYAIEAQLTDVYYNGTEEDWQSVVIGEGNSGLLQATFHFLGETEVTPTPTPTTAPKPTVTTAPTATPKPTATPTPVPTATPSPKPTATPVPTAKPSPTPVPAWKNPFADVKRYDWFYGAVEFVNVNGIMLGDSSGKFNPETKLTRAEIAQIIYNIEGGTVKSLAHFKDVDNGKWYAKAANWAFEKGIISGYADGTFCPDRTATREELIAVIYRYAIYKGYNVAEGLKTNISGFADNEMISSWAKTAMNWAIGEEIIGGKPGTIIDPKGTATRAETAQIFMGLLKNR